MPKDRPILRYSLATIFGDKLYATMKDDKTRLEYNANHWADTMVDCTIRVMPYGPPIAKVVETRVDMVRHTVDLVIEWDSDIAQVSTLIKGD